MTDTQSDGLLLWEAFRDFGDDPVRCPPAGGEALDRYIAQLRRGAKSRRQHYPRIHVPDGLKTMCEAASKVGCSIKTLKGHIASGALGYVVIGHGTKRPRKMFTDTDINQFIANQTRKDVAACPSSPTSARRTINTTSSSEVIAFTALPRPRPSGKPKK